MKHLKVFHWGIQYDSHVEFEFCLSIVEPLFDHIQSELLVLHTTQVYFILILYLEKIPLEETGMWEPLMAGVYKDYIKDIDDKDYKEVVTEFVKNKVDKINAIK